MVASFDEAIKVVLKHEGGFVDDPSDRGGATNYGISSRFLNIYSLDESLKKEIDFNRDNYIDAEEIKKMSKDTAKEIYKKCWWDKFKYGKLLDQDLATKIFDIAVNIGPYQAHKILQEAINNKINHFPIAVDGIIGNKTRNATNLIDPKILRKEFITLVSDFYKELCNKNVNFRKYLQGWLNRVND